MILFSRSHFQPSVGTTAPRDSPLASAAGIEVPVEHGDDADDGTPVPVKELTDEIRAFREKAKAFKATNDHQTYLIVVFSVSEDRETFLRALGYDPDVTHTTLDGYDVARRVQLAPTLPSVILPRPLGLTR